jgi:hypothetical protein
VRANVAEAALLGDTVVGTKLVIVGAVRSMVTVAATALTAGPVLSAPSFTAPPASVKITVPFEGLVAVTETVYGPAPEPLGVPTLQPDDVPDNAKSAAVSSDTDSENVTL